MGPSNADTGIFLPFIRHAEENTFFLGVSCCTGPAKLLSVAIVWHPTTHRLCGINVPT
ncbi:hypothetical protein ACFFWC_25760 [Plantactinospora siamensis]|uniref:Uncharacterized protein n=1 Tax=Plantactinospora siamensis TaxID=555372 RepID=A0ABV6P5Q6_9ACTN